VSVVECLVIAIAQTLITEDPRENGVAIRSAMRRAAARDARLIQFPEGALSGYAKEQIPNWDVVNWEAVGAEVDQVAELARELGVWVLLGSAHPLTAPNRPHNSMYVISDDGAIVDRYDKRICSNTEITEFFTPGFEPVVFDVDGVRFGCAVCIEVNFPELFAEYERLGVQCLLLSAYPVDSIFAVKASAHAAINNYWVGLSAPQQTQHLFPAALFGPNGDTLAQVEVGDDLVVAQIDPDDPAFHVALDFARPWRPRARDGDIYERHRVADQRSTDRSAR
jgi:predicted amidohydrolase